MSTPCPLYSVVSHKSLLYKRMSSRPSPSFGVSLKYAGQRGLCWGLPTVFIWVQDATPCLSNTMPASPSPLILEYSSVRFFSQAAGGFSHHQHSVVSGCQRQEDNTQTRKELLKKMLLKAFLERTLSLGQAFTDAPARPLQAHMERQEGTWPQTLASWVRLVWQNLAPSFNTSLL